MHNIYVHILRETITSPVRIHGSILFLLISII